MTFNKYDNCEEPLKYIFQTKYKFGKLEKLIL
jgi:hypothetical protein